MSSSGSKISATAIDAAVAARLPDLLPDAVMVRDDDTGKIAEADLPNRLSSAVQAAAITSAVAGVRDDPLAPFWRMLGTDPAAAVALLLGTSTTASDSDQKKAGLRNHMTNGCALAGMNPGNVFKHGNVGFPWREYLNHEAGVEGAQVPPYPWTATVAAGPHIIIAEPLINDIVLMGATLLEAIQILEEVIALRDRDLPGVPIAFWVPVPFTTDVPDGGTDFFAGRDHTPAEANAIIRGAYMAIRDRFDHVDVWDTAELFGTATLPTHPDKQDPLHPEVWTQYRLGQFFAGKMAPPGKTKPAMGPSRPFTRNAKVLYSTSGLLQLQALEMLGGASPYETVTMAPYWLIDQTASLYLDGGSVDLTGATFTRPSSTILQINKAGVDFPTLAPDNTIVQLVASYADDGFTRVAGDYVDPPALAPGAMASVDAACLGIRRGQTFSLLPPAGLPAGYSLTAFAVSDNVVRIAFTNTSAGAVDYGADLWEFRF